MNCILSLDRKNEIYILTAVDRATRRIVRWAVERARIFEVIQPLVDQAVRAKQYFSDGLASYADVYYHGALYQAMLDKSQTYSVEGDNAELRHYLHAYIAVHVAIPNVCVRCNRHLLYSSRHGIVAK